MKKAEKPEYENTKNVNQKILKMTCLVKLRHFYRKYSSCLWKSLFAIVQKNPGWKIQSTNEICRKSFKIVLKHRPVKSAVVMWTCIKIKNKCQSGPHLSLNVNSLTSQRWRRDKAPLLFLDQNMLVLLWGVQGYRSVWSCVFSCWPHSHSMVPSSSSIHPEPLWGKKQQTIDRSLTENKFK